MVIPAFGWSLGDVFDCIEFLWRLREAFRETGGAVEKFGEATEYLSSFQNAIGRVETYVANHQDDPQSADILSHLRAVNVPCQRLKMILDGYKCDLAKTSTSNRVRKATKITSWTFKYCSGEMRKLKADLAEPMQALMLSLLLQLAEINIQDSHRLVRLEQSQRLAGKRNVSLLLRAVEATRAEARSAHQILSDELKCIKDTVDGCSRHGSVSSDASDTHYEASEASEETFQDASEYPTGNQSSVDLAAICKQPIDFSISTSSRTFNDYTSIKSLAPKKTICWQRSGGCFCRCHTTTNFEGRFISMKRPAWLGFSNHCDVQGCNSRRFMLSFRSVLTWLGLPLAMRLEIIVSGLSIAPSLWFESVQPDASPGFKIITEFQALWFSSNKYETVEIRVFRPELKMIGDQKFHKVRTLFRNGTIGFDDVDSEGRTWLEKIIQQPWAPEIREFQWKLLTIVCQENPRILKHNLRLLNKHIFNWISKGLHLSLLERLLKLGLDTGFLDVQELRQWQSLPTVFFDASHSDPFGMKFVEKCLESEPEFASCNAFLEKVLIGSYIELEGYLEQSSSLAELESMCNLFGQSALHLSILKPGRLRLLLDKGFDPDPPDNGGTTPLMYAAAYGKPESVSLLLERGANLWIRDTHKNYSFVNYAAIKQNWKVIEVTVDWSLRQKNGQTLATEILGIYLVESFRNYSYHELNKDQLRRAFDLGADPNFTYQGTTLMHVAQWSVRAHEILNDGSAESDIRDRDSITALMSRFRSPGIASPFSEKVPLYAVNMQNKSGWTALHECLARMWFEPNYSPRSDVDPLRRLKNFQTIMKLQSHGAKFWVRDACRCACSPTGCSALTLLFRRSCCHVSRSEWPVNDTTLPPLHPLIDWYLIVKAGGVFEDVLKTVRETQRFLAFAISRLPHACRYGDSSSYSEVVSKLAPNRGDSTAGASEDDLDSLALDEASMDDLWSDALAALYTAALPKPVNKVMSREMEKVCERRTLPPKLCKFSTKFDYQGKPEEEAQVNERKDGISSVCNSSRHHHPWYTLRMNKKDYFQTLNNYIGWAELCWKQGAFEKFPRGNDWWYDSACRFTLLLGRKLSEAVRQSEGE